jgi:hypothetical protein
MINLVCIANISFHIKGRVQVNVMELPRLSSVCTLGSSNPNMSRIPMNPSVACLTAVLRTAMDRLDLDPAVPTVDAC